MTVRELKCCAHEVDVIVHIDDNLDIHYRTHLEDAVERKPGVMKARFNAQRHHLLVVAYDPKRINSEMILNHIKHQKVNAQLIGGI